MVETVPFESVTKLECAERQLRVAIRLFFERRDLIAVHSLTAAAQEVVRQLAKPRGFKGIYEHADELIRPEKKKEFIERIRAPQNFFKHASKDSNQKLKFHYEVTKFLLFDAVLLCSSLKGPPYPPEFSAFIGWFMHKYPKVFKDDGGIMSVAKQMVKGIDFDDFELILSAIDCMAGQAK